jgi:tRNA-binding protein
LASLDDFLSLQIQVGTIVSAELQKGAPKPALALRIDFGELGSRNASAPITDLYDAEDLVGLQVVAVMNLPSRRVAGLDSEVVVLAADNGRGERTLLIPERPVPDGARVD